MYARRESEQTWSSRRTGARARVTPPAVALQTWSARVHGGPARHQTPRVVERAPRVRLRSRRAIEQAWRIRVHDPRVVEQTCSARVHDPRVVGQTCSAREQTSRARRRGGRVRRRGGRVRKRPGVMRDTTLRVAICRHSAAIGHLQASRFSAAIRGPRLPEHTGAPSLAMGRTARVSATAEVRVGAPPPVFRRRREGDS